MQTIAFHVGKFAPRSFISCTRLFSTTCLRTTTGRNEAHKYIAGLSASTRHPLWKLVDGLHAPLDRVYLHQSLQDNNVSAHEFQAWKLVLLEPDIDQAVSLLRKRGYMDRHYISPESIPNACEPIPSWVVLFLITYRVQTPSQANGSMMELAFGHLPSVLPIVRGPLLILAAFNLGRFNLLVPLRRVLEAFLAADLPNETKQFNHLLQALSTVPYRSVEHTMNVTNILRIMDERRLYFLAATYEALLNDHSTTLPIAKQLFIRLMRGGFTPSAYQLEAFLRLFLKLGEVELAEKFFKAIHMMEGGQLKEDATSDDYRIRANTLMLNSFASRQKAAAFLSQLVATIPDKASKDDDKNAASSLRKSLFVHRLKPDIYDDTAVLHVAAKDTTISAAQLIDVFNSLPENPTIATHTVLLKGFMIRKDFKKAYIFWSKIIKQSKLKVDEEALAMGVYAQTRYQRPHEAFQLLEKYAVKPGEEPAIINDETKQSSFVISTILMNEYLAALKQISRPDAVFRLWDYMDTLYGTYPNAMSLSILLQSARLAHKMDDCLGGVIAKLGLINPFRSKKRYTVNDRRLEAVDAIITCIGHPSRGNLRKYRSGIWRNQEPMEFARKIFLQCLFGNDTNGLLSSVESPARACRKSHDDDASSSIGVPNFAPRKYVFQPPEDLLTPEGRSHYPQIIINNPQCFNYITLIGICGRAEEIPLVLAWMRKIGIQPSNSTLAVSLVFWSEISVQAPLIEKWNGGPDQNEYMKLVGWIEDWVGKERLPNDELLRKWRSIVLKMRAPNG